LRHTRRSWVGLIVGALFGRKAAADVGLDPGLAGSDHSVVTTYANTVTPGADLTLEAIQEQLARIELLPKASLLLVHNADAPRLWDYRYAGAVMPIDDPFSPDPWYGVTLFPCSDQRGHYLLALHPPGDPPTHRP